MHGAFVCVVEWLHDNDDDDSSRARSAYAVLICATCDRPRRTCDSDDNDANDNGCGVCVWLSGFGSEHVEMCGTRSCLMAEGVL